MGTVKSSRGRPSLHVKTIDALKADKRSIIPEDEHRNLVDTLIENGQIKEILAKRLSL
jgi:hypothetical protein